MAFLFTPAAVHHPSRPQVSAKTKAPLLPCRAPGPHRLPQATVPALCALAVVMAAALVEVFLLRELSSQRQPDRSGAGQAQSQMPGGGGDQGLVLHMCPSLHRTSGQRGKGSLETGDRALHDRPSRLQRPEWALSGMMDWPPLPPVFWPGLCAWQPSYQRLSFSQVS